MGNSVISFVSTTVTSLNIFNVIKAESSLKYYISCEVIWLWSHYNTSNTSYEEVSAAAGAGEPL